MGYSVRNNGLFIVNFCSRTVFPIGHFTQGGVSLCPGLKQRSTQLIIEAFQAKFALIETLPKLHRLMTKKPRQHQGFSLECRGVLKL